MRSLILTYFLLSSLLIYAQVPEDTLVIGYTQAAPFIIADNSDSDSNEIYGISIWLWEEVAKELDAPFRYERMNFIEMLDALDSNTIDVSINPLTISSERMERMNFTLPFYPSNSTVAIDQPSGIHQFLHFLKAIFNINFWRVVFGLIFLIAVFGTAVWLFERKKNPEQFRNSPKGIWDGLWWSAVTMTTVGYGDKAPKSRPGKMIALIWMFSGIIFISGFTASIASILTVSNMHSNANELNDFKKRDIGTISSTSTFQFLKVNFFNNLNGFNNLTEGLGALKSGKVDAFIYDEPIMRYRINQDPDFSGLEVLPLKFNTQFYAFATAKNKTDLNNQISRAITEIIEGTEWRILLAEYQLGEF